MRIHEDEKLYLRTVSESGRVRYVDSGKAEWDCDTLPTKGATLIQRDGKRSTWYAYGVEPDNAAVLAALHTAKQAMVAAIQAAGLEAMHLRPGSDDDMLAAWECYVAEMNRRGVNPSPLICRGTSPTMIVNAAIFALEESMRADED